MTNKIAARMRLLAGDPGRTSACIDSMAQLLCLALATVAVAGCAHLGAPARDFPRLAEALDRFAGAERSRDWPAMYSMLSPDIAGDRTLVAFTDEMDQYAGRLALVAWRLARATPGGDNRMPGNAWVIVEGCGCYRENDQYQAWRTTTIAVRTTAGWRFDGITIASVVDGPALRCVAREVPDSPCKPNQRAASDSE